jgi:hypothetical protein
LQFPRFWKLLESNDKPVIQTVSKTLTPSVLASEARANDKNSSTQVNDSLIWLVEPEVPFNIAYSHFKTSGKFFNAVEAYVSEFLSRDWSYEGDESGIKAMEEFEEEFELSVIAEAYARDMMVCGNFIIGIADWKPAPITMIRGVKRDTFGNIESYWYYGKANTLKPMGTPKEFAHDRYITIGKDAWGYGMAHALMSQYTDEDGNISKSALDIDKQVLQDFAKIYHKYASPRSVWSFPTVTNPDDFNTDNPNSLATRIKKMKAGDRLAVPMEVSIITEGVDAQARFTDGIDAIIDPEINAGLANSANRVLTDPSAMADASAAGEKDDAKLLGLMEKFRRFVNTEIIPRVTDKDVTFKWGSKDEFDFDPQLALSLLGAGVIGKTELRKMIADIGMPLDDAAFALDEEAKMQQQMDMMAQQGGVNPFDKQPKPPMKRPDGSEPEDVDDEDDDEDEEETEALRREAYRKIIKAVDSQ